MNEYITVQYDYFTAGWKGGAALPPGGGLRKGIFPGTAMMSHGDPDWDYSVSYPTNCRHSFNSFFLNSHSLPVTLLDPGAAKPNERGSWPQEAGHL